MSDPRREYLELMAAVFRERHAHEGETDEELRLIDEMERVWRKVPPAGQSELNLVSAQIACGMLDPMTFVTLLERLPPGMSPAFTPEARISKLTLDLGRTYSPEWQLDPPATPTPASTISLESA